MGIDKAALERIKELEAQAEDLNDMLDTVLEERDELRDQNKALRGYLGQNLNVA